MPIPVWAILVAATCRGPIRLQWFCSPTACLSSQRPKRAYGHLTQCERFVPEYRDAAALAERAKRKGLTRVAIVPFRGPSGLGRDVAHAWLEDAAKAVEEHAEFTWLVSTATLEDAMHVSQLGSAGFHPPDALRVDNSVMTDSQGHQVRLPYLKLPRNPELQK